MNKAISPVELYRAKKIMRNLAKAAHKIHERSAAKQDLHQQFKKVKKYAVDKRIKDKTLDDEIELLNKKINKVLHKETELLDVEKQDALEVKRLQNRIKALEAKIGGIDVPKLVNELFKVEALLSEDRDVHSLEVLKEKVQEIEDRIKHVSSEDVKEAVNRVTKKIEGLMDLKTEREKHIEKLEEQIKKKVEEETSEIKKLDEQIEHLEQRLLHAKISGNHPPEKIEAVEHKINELKLKSVEAKLKKHKVDLNQLDKAVETRSPNLLHEALKPQPEKFHPAKLPKKTKEEHKGPSRVDVSHLIEEKPKLDLGKESSMPPPPPPMMAGAPKSRGILDKVKHILG